MARILVVDDEANVRRMIRLALEHIGHSVETGADGPESLDRFGDGAGWDLVLLDHRMPGMEGLDVLRILRERRPDARVVMITAFGTIDLAMEATMAGAADFLRKPFTTEILRGVVKAALREPSPAQAAEPSADLSFAPTAVNGFRIEQETGGPEPAHDALRFRFVLRDPEYHAHPCAVILPSSVMESARRYAERAEMPGGDRFWRALCEETLVNYVWQNASCPPEGALVLDSLTTGHRRWIDAALTASR